MKPDHLLQAAVDGPRNTSVCSLRILTSSTTKGPWGVKEILNFGTENIEKVPF